MQTSHQKYKVRAGTLDSGKEYEFKMVTLLSLRCLLEDAEDVWLVSNADSVGAFDDIIFRVQRTANEGMTYMLQLKHKENSNNVVESEFLSAKGDFSLSKYSKDLTKLKQSCESKQLGIVSDLGDFDKITFALFTNRGVNEYEFLENIYYPHGMVILNTNKNNHNLHKINYKKCGFDVNGDNCLSLHFISNQAHVTHLNEEISGEVKKLVDKFELTHVNIKFVTEKFTKYVFEWAKGHLGGHYYLNKHDIYSKVTELLLQQYAIDLNTEEYAFYDEDRKHIWNKILSDKLITVVERDDEALKFLKLYLGSEVKKYLRDTKEAKLWLDNLSKQAQNCFYQENLDIKEQMLKVVGNHGKITFVDVYKCLWFSNKLPLLLQANNTQECDNIMKILKFAKYNVRVVIVNITSLSLITRQHLPRCFTTLNDLDKEARDIILDQSVKLQGRASILLRELVHEDIFEEIKPKDIIQILSGNFNVGNKYNPLSDCFVKRILSKIFIKREALTNIQSEVFLIENPHQINFAAEDFKCGNIISSEEEEKIQKLKSEGKTIHRVILLSSCLEWKETVGSIRSIREFRLEEVEDVEEEISIEGLIEGHHKLNTSCIISASPGMGKSTLLDYVAAQTSTDRWVVRVDLNDHHDYYEAMKRKDSTYGAVDHLRYFNQQFNHTKMPRMVFERLLATKSILALLDGFDEISISYKEEVTQIARSLHEDGYLVWITTRPIMKSYLEEQLNTLSITIEPFSLHDQVYFLTRYFTEIAGNPEEELIAEFVVTLLQAAQVNLSDSCLEFTEIPLQTMLLADVFSSELMRFLSTGSVDVHRKFDLLYLYQEFIRRKNQILCDKFGMGMKNMRVVFEEHQQLLAVTYLFEEHLHELEVCKKAKKYYRENPEQLPFLQLEGVLVVEQTDDHFKISFVHRTFAEYLAALWISDNINSADVVVKTSIKKLVELRSRYSNLVCPFLFRIFDSILAKGCDAHSAIIHDRIDELKAMMMLNPDGLDAVDAGGRTVLHMMAMYKVKFDHYHFEDLQDETKMLDILQNIPNHKITNGRDRLGYSALDYAVGFWNLRFANKMCEKSPFLKLGFRIGLQEMYFKSCALHELKFVFKVLFAHFAYERILFWSHAKHLTIESFCETLSASPALTQIVTNFTKNVRAATLWDLFQFESMNDLRFTVIYGTKSLLALLLSKGADINGCDIYQNSPLHYSALHDRLDMVKLLISKGADLNKPGQDGWTALHYAVDHAHDDIVKELLRRGADMNQMDNKGNTPLHLAFDSFDDDTAKILLLKGVKTNLANKKGKVPLHYAAKHGNDKIIAMLLSEINDDEESVSVNCEMNNGKTPLHSLVSRPMLCDDDDILRYERSFYLLLRAGADLNIQDKNGNTPLHYLSRKNYWEDNRNCVKDYKNFVIFLAELLLKKGADTNLKNEDGKTALDLATDADKTEFIYMLQRNGRAYEEIFIHEECDIQEQPRVESSPIRCTLS